MAIKSRRAYKGAAVANALATPINATDTTISLTATMSGWATSGTPFFCVIDPGTTKEEKICVIYASSTTLTVVDPATTSAWSANVNGRGVDDTSDRAHDAGAVIYPVFTAYEANEANELASKYASTGAMVYQDASSFASLALGTSGYPLVAGASAPAYSQVDTVGIADSAITSVKIADGAIVNADVNASAAIAYSKLNLGTSIVNADVSASAAIALSKLATGALPTAITVTSANISDLSIVDADVSASAAIALSKLATTGTVTATTFVGALTGNASGTSGSTTGNAATATALQTSRNIGGVSFNGTADINLPGVNASGNQNTSGTATNATNLVGLFKGSSVVSMVSGSAAVPHGVGATPSTALVSNGDNSALSASFEIASLDGTYINVRQIGGTATTSVRVNWIAFA